MNRSLTPAYNVIHLLESLVWDMLVALDLHISVDLYQGVYSYVVRRDGVMTGLGAGRSG